MQGQWPTHLINEDLCLVTKWLFLVYVFLDFLEGGWLLYQIRNRKKGFVNLFLNLG